MITSLFGVPTLTLQDFYRLMTELGTNFTHVTSSGQPKPVSVNRGRQYDPIPIYAQRVQHLPLIIQKTRQYNVCVFISDVPELLSELSNMQFLLYRFDSDCHPTVTAKDIKRALDTVHQNTHVTAEKTVSSPIQDAITAADSKSVLSPLLTAFYKVDSDNRALVRSTVLSYLSGRITEKQLATQVSPVGNSVQRVLQIVSSPEVKKLQQACLYARRTDAESAATKFRASVFDINYILTRPV